MIKEDWNVIGISRSYSDFKHSNFFQIKANMYSYEQVKTLIKKIPKNNIYALINNVGGLGPIGKFEGINIKDWIDTFKLNLFSPLMLTQKIIPNLRRNKGSIIFISGGGSAYPIKNFSPYGVSKTAVVRMTEVLSKELFPDIFVYVIAPGPIRTKLFEKADRAGLKVPKKKVG